MIWCLLANTRRNVLYVLFVLESERREIRKDVSSRMKVEQAVVQFQSRLQIIMGI